MGALEVGDRVEVRGMNGRVRYVGEATVVTPGDVWVVPDGKVKARRELHRACRTLERRAPAPGALVAKPDTSRRPGKPQPRAPKPPRNPAYLAHVRSLPCACCESKPPNQAHHQPRRGHATTGGKCSDYQTVSLCPLCHHRWHSEGRLGSMNHEQTLAFLRERAFETFERWVVEFTKRIGIAAPPAPPITAADYREVGPR